LSKAPGTEELDRLEHRLFWIFSGPRTGSTWLLELLCHPFRPSPQGPAGASAVRDQSSLRRALPRIGAPRPTCMPIDEPYLPQHLQPLLTLRAGADDVSGPAHLTLNETRDNDPSYFFSERFAPAWRPALRTLILTRFLAQAREFRSIHGGADVPVVVKEPNGSYGAELVASLLPRCGLIFLLRDPRDVIDSLIDAMTPGGWLADEPYMPTLATPGDRLDFARHEARSWQERTRAVCRAYDAHDPGRRYRLRYEDLRAEPERLLGDLLEWMGQPRSPAALGATVESNSFERIPGAERGRGKPRRSATPGLWRERLSDREVEGVREIAGELMDELGYGD
jgi:sulfotransferase family protein